MDKATLWVTGATGFVGGHFVYHALKHSEARIVAVVRDSTRAGQDGLARLQDVLHGVADAYHEAYDAARFEGRLCVVSGDITQPACGVDPAALADADPSCVVIHIAASLKFEDAHAAEIRAHNVDGTRNALALADRIGTQKFVYLSTAYTCGARVGDVDEVLHPRDATFNNIYEETKCTAEHEVTAWAARAEGRRHLILRPSVVVGPLKTHSPGGSDTGLYGFAREMERLGKTLRRANAGVALRGQPEAGLNLIPVDHLVREMWSLIVERDDAGPIHHLTSEAHPNIREVVEAVQRVCELPALGLVDDPDAPRSPVEQAMDRRARFYASYMRDPKRFLRRAGPGVTVTKADLEAYVRAYIFAFRRRRLAADATRRVLHDVDGPLLTLSMGAPDRPLLVLCNALGMPSEIWLPLMRALAHDHRVVTWEPRADADTGRVAPSAQRYPDSELRALARVLRDQGEHGAYLVGWCTGADVAVRYAHAHPQQVRGVICLSGALNFASAERTRFQRSLAEVVQRAAGSLRHAALYHALLFGQGASGYGAIANNAAHDGALLSSMVASLAPELLYLTSAPFRDPESLHVYAQRMQEYYEHCARTPFPALESQVLVVAGGADEVAHVETSRAAAARWPNAVLREKPEGDHFLLHHDAELPHEIARFVQDIESARAAHAR